MLGAWMSPDEDESPPIWHSCSPNPYLPSSSAKWAGPGILSPQVSATRKIVKLQRRFESTSWTPR